MSAFVTPILDIMQTMPPFADLVPIALGFGIGPTTAIVLTVIYAMPPMVRITEHGIRSVPETTIEAARSLGLTRRQMLRQVQLPMARRTIVVGVNQSMMAALSMATIAALVNGPGLGKDVYAALQIQNIGAASVAGILIVLTAIMLDRTTTAASELSESQGRSGVASVSGPGVMLSGVVLERMPRWATEEAGKGVLSSWLTPAGRWLVRGLWLIPVLIIVYFSRQQLILAQFPTRERLAVPEVHRRQERHQAGQRLLELVHRQGRHLHPGPEERPHRLLINPLQTCSPTRRGGSSGWRCSRSPSCSAGGAPSLHTGVRGVILATGLWHDTMITLTMTLVATRW